MDRRDFIQKLLLAPLLVPLLRESSGLTGDKELFLISDEPHKILPRVLHEMPFFPMKSQKGLSFLSPHPQKKDLTRGLSEKGWVPVPSPEKADLSLSFSPLRHPVPPSFTLVTRGKIRDIRTPGLFSLWQDMLRSHKPSSCLTIASIFPDRTVLFSGEFAAVYKEGKMIENLSLMRPLSRTYRTRAGRVSVRVENGKVWVTESSCRNKICCSVPPVSLSGERIICAPNHFLLEIQGAHSIDTAVG